MARNKQVDLNNILFEQMERLNDDEYMIENGELEIKRAQSISTLSKNILSNFRLALDVSKHIEESGMDRTGLPTLLIEDE